MTETEVTAEAPAEAPPKRLSYQEQKRQKAAEEARIKEILEQQEKTRLAVEETKKKVANLRDQNSKIKQSAEDMMDRVEEVEQKIDDVYGQKHQEATAKLFGQILTSKLEYDYTYGKKLNYFDGVPNVMRPKVVKRERNTSMDKLKKQMLYLKEQDARGFYVEDDKQEVSQEMAEEKKREAAKHEEERSKTWK